MHDLKLTFGRRLRAAGASHEDRQDLPGHKSGRITAHWSAAELEHLIEAANRVCAENSRKSPALVLLKQTAVAVDVITAQCRGEKLARPERFELPTAWFVARYSIQLSYGRVEAGNYPLAVTEIQGMGKRDCLRYTFTLRTGLLPFSHPCGAAAARLRRCLAPLRGARLEPKGSHRASLTPKQKKAPLRGPFSVWRRERDSNPRWAFNPYSLSRGAPSAARPSLPGAAGWVLYAAERLAYR